MLLQIAGIVGIATMLILCVFLAQKKNTKHFVTVGQSVFAWLGATLSIFLCTRLVAISHALTIDEARTVNSIAFIACVIGILITVYAHGRAHK